MKTVRQNITRSLQILFALLALNYLSACSGKETVLTQFNSKICSVETSGFDCIKETEIEALRANSNLNQIKYPDGSIYLGEVKFGSLHQKHGLGYYASQNGDGYLAIWKDGELLYKREKNIKGGNVGYQEICQNERQIFMHECNINDKIFYNLFSLKDLEVLDAFIIPMWRGEPNGVAEITGKNPQGYYVDASVNFQNGVENGEAIFQVQTSDGLERYFINFEGGNPIFGKIKYSSGAVYEGQVSSGSILTFAKNGYGTLTTSDNAQFKGYFRDNKAHGYQRLSYPDGLTSYGNYVDNRPHGPLYILDQDFDYLGKAYFILGEQVSAGDFLAQNIEYDEFPFNLSNNVICEKVQDYIATQDQELALFIFELERRRAKC